MFQIELRSKTGDQLVAHAYLETLVETPQLVIFDGHYFIHREGLVFTEAICVAAKSLPKPLANGAATDATANMPASAHMSRKKRG